MTHESSDESESICGPFWAPKAVNSSGISFDTLKHIDDGWGALREPTPVPPGSPSTPQSSWHLFSDAILQEARGRAEDLIKQQEHHCSLNHWKCLHRRDECKNCWNELYLRLSIPFNMVSYPNGLPCRAQTTKSSLVTTKMSRPYETDMLLREYPIPLNAVTPLGANPVCDAHDRRHFSLKHDNRFDNSVFNRSLEQTRLSILSWNPGPRRGREIAYLQHESLTKHFYITHLAGCAVVVNKDTFHSDIQLPPRHREWAASSRERRTVRMGTTSRHLPCLVPGDTAKWQVLFYHGVAPHPQHTGPKRGIAKILLLAVRTVMLQEQVDMVAGDFNGAAWRPQSGSDPRPVSIVEEAFVNTNLLVPLGRPPGGRREVCQVNCLTCVGS